MKIPTSSPDEGTQVPFALLQQHVSAFIHASLPLCLHVMYRAGMYRAARKSNATSTRRTWPSRTLIRGLAMRNDDIFVGHRKLKQSALPISSPRPKTGTRQKDSMHYFDSISVSHISSPVFDGEIFCPPHHTPSKIAQRQRCDVLICWKLILVPRRCDDLTAHANL